MSHIRQRDPQKKPPCIFHHRRGSACLPVTQMPCPCLPVTQMPYCCPGIARFNRESNLPGIAGSMNGGSSSGQQALPVLLSSHHGLVLELAAAHAAYGPTVRLVKRWLGAHLLLGAQVKRQRVTTPTQHCSPQQPCRSMGCSNGTRCLFNTVPPVRAVAPPVCIFHDHGS